MKNIIKIFVETYMMDMEGRYGWWNNFEGIYEEACDAVKAGKFECARLIEKTFNPETFIITEKVLRETERVYEGLWWNGEVKEKVY